MGGGFRKPRPANKPVAFHPGRGAPDFLAQTRSLFCKVFVETIDLQTTPFLHGGHSFPLLHWAIMRAANEKLT